MVSAEKQKGSHSPPTSKEALTLLWAVLNMEETLTLGLS
jgi:hypothetical protein